MSSPISGLVGGTTEGCLDEVHQRRHGKYYSGGPLDVRKVSLSSDAVPVNSSFGGEGDTRRWTVSGTIYPIFWGGGSNDWSEDALPASGMSATEGYGAQAWNKFKPGKPKASAAVFLAEMRDLPGMLQKKAYAHRNLGKHYLNAQFGWLPFVSDLRKMYSTQQNMSGVLATIQQMNGKWVQRTGSVERNEVIQSRWSDSGRIPVFTPLVWADVDNQDLLACQGQVTELERVWFSGRFRYYIDDIASKIKSPKWRRNTARKVMGLSITPSEVWELVPWSWLIDYFSNFGAVIDNLNTGYVDNLVSSYAYVMRENITRAEQTSHGVLSNGVVYSGNCRREVVTRCRAAADPFGFQVSANLNSRQLAILAALGDSFRK